MIEPDRPLLAGWLTAASEVYDKPLSTAAIEVWWNLLRAFPAEKVDRAFKAHIADPDTGRFMPRPADIIARMTIGSEGAANEAWVKAIKAARHHGAGRSVAFDDPLIHACLDALGGWPRFCMMREDDQHFRRLDFVRIYTAHRMRGDKPTYSGVLYGRMETTKVTLIGDEQRCLAVIENGTPMDMTGRIIPLAAVDALTRIGANPRPAIAAPEDKP